MKFEQYHVDRADVRWLAWGVTVFAGLTMVSNFKFYSGKDINLRKSVPFSAASISPVSSRSSGAM